MNWVIPDVSLVVATISLVFLIFLTVGIKLKVRERFFQLWALAWLLSIFHNVGQLLQAASGRVPVAGGFLNFAFAGYSATAFFLAAELLRGRSPKRTRTCAGFAVLMILTVWAYVEHYGLVPWLKFHATFILVIGIILAATGVSHYMNRKANPALGITILSSSFFLWALTFFAFVAIRNLGVMQDSIRYIYLFSNLPKPIVAIGMLIFLLEREQVETERQRSAAERERDFSETLIETAPDGIFMLDLDSNILRANKRFQEICGKSADELLGAPLATVAPPFELESHHENLSEAYAGNTVSYRSLVVRREGSPNHAVITINPLKFGDRIVGATGTMKDVTERDSLEQKLLQSEKMASIGLLVSGVAHELNNPLTSVLGFTELALNDREMTPALASWLEVVLKEAKRTRGMVQKLLKAVRQQKPERAPVKINQIVRDTIALRQYDFNVNNVHIESELSEGIPLVLADGSELQQVVINLLQNAYDAIKESAYVGTIKVRTFYDGQAVVVEVIDSGPGVTEPERVFDLFYSTKEPGKGTGLGLAICYQIMKACGGEIGVRNLSEGANFFFKIPAADIRLTHLPEPAEEESHPDIAGRVLIVDDEPTILSLAREILRPSGIKVETAQSGDEAMEILSRSVFDAVVTDYRMPGASSGADVYYWLRDNRQGREESVVFMTGDAINADTHRFFQKTQCKVIFKPFEPGEFVSAVRKAMGSGAVRVPERQVV